MCNVSSLICAEMRHTTSHMAFELMLFLLCRRKSTGQTVESNSDALDTYIGSRSMNTLRAS